MIEPLVSVPTAPAAKDAEIAAPLPEEEPQGLRSRLCGLRVWPPMADQPELESLERKFAHWLRLVFPKITAPASRSPWVSGASRPVILSFSASAPAVVARLSLLSMLSLRSIARP